MNWFWYWVLITAIPAGFVALNAKDISGFFVRCFSFIALFLLIGVFTAFGLYMLSNILQLGQGIGNWWSSQTDSSGSASGGNEVPPYFFLIPMFMMLGFIIRGNGKQIRCSF